MSNIYELSTFNISAQRAPAGVSPYLRVFSLILFFATIFFPTSLVALGSTEESGFEEATGIQNWSHDIPVEDLEPGTYNLLVRATDRAGNTASAEPLDLVVDPESDIPTATISTPSPDAVVGSRLLVLGTARDDDAVAAVRVQVDEDQAKTAEGREFWSAGFDISDLDEGEHTISAVARDENGLESEAVSVTFNLDLSGPEIEVANLESGALVADTVTVEGSVVDGNGLASLSVQYGTAEDRESLRVRGGRIEQSFSHRFNTRAHEDGPLVLWFTARDVTGATTRFPFLMFVDNTSPELSIRAPGDEPVPAGMVRFTGVVRDSLGISSLAYETRSGAEGNLELSPGDPFWAVSLDLSDVGRREVFDITATDSAGNTSSLRRRVSIDRDADLPRISDFRIGADYISGSAMDDDAVQAVEYRIDRGEWIRTATARSFAVPTPELPPGEYDVTLRAVDVHDRVGPEVEGSIEILPERPLFTDLRLLGPEGETEEPFYSGHSLYESEPRMLVGAVTNAAGLRHVRYRFDGAADWSRTRVNVDADSAKARFELQLGRRQQAGRHSLELQVENSLGIGDHLRSFYYLLQREPEEPDPDESYLTEIPDAPGLYLSDGRWDRDSGLITLRNSRPVSAFVAKSEISDARLEPDAREFSLIVDDQVLRIEALEEGRAEDVRLVVDTRAGEQYQSETFDLLYDTEAPELRIEAPQTDSWHDGAVEVRVSVKESVGEPRVRYAVADGAFTDLAALDDRSAEDDSGSGVSARAAATRRYAFTLGPPQQDASMTAWVRASDTAGNTVTRAIRVNFDTTAPTVTYLSPGEDEAVNGKITVVGEVADEGPLAVLGWRDNAAAAGNNVGGDAAAGGNTGLQALDAGAAFSFKADLTRYVDSPRRPVVVAEDAAGNRAEVEMDFPIDAAADQPRVSVQLPPEDSVHREDFVLSGTVFDDDGIAEVLAKVDDGPYRLVSSGNTFSVPIDVQELGDNEHTVTVKAVDLGGVESDEEAVSFSISLDSPSGAVVTPELAAPVRKQVLIGGSAEDANGIRGVELSFDNGSSFHRAVADEAGYAEWSYPLNTETLTDGLHAVQVRVRDELDTETLFSSLITVDNTAPEVELDLPQDGAVSTGTFPISGRVRDGGRLAEVELRITPRSQNGIDPRRLEVRPGPGGVVQGEFDLSDVPPGSYDVELTARDESANRGSASRNVVVRAADEELQRLDLYAPFEGARKTGVVNVEGRVVSDRDVPTVTVRLDGTSIGIAEVNADGFFSLAVDTEGLTGGAHDLAVTANGAGGESLQSPTRSFYYEGIGPWVQVDSHQTGDSVRDRPRIVGRAGYFFEEPQDLEEGSREYRRALRKFEISRVDVSLDNGASYERVSGEENWEYRIETENLPDGRRPVLVRATARNGRQAFRRIHIRIDTSPPNIQVDLPVESGRFNDLVSAGGSASDEYAVEQVEVVLREGSKNRYEVPEFIQGLYADVHLLGASSWDAGLGLTFFDDNVKLQGQIGSAPPGRFSGLVLGGKLLANVARLPFSSLLGPNFSFLSGSLAVGANFSYFTMSEDEIGFTDDGLVLGGVVGQLEFPIMQVESWRAFNVYSLYTEGQLWFISSDIQGGVETKLSFGVRVQLL